MQERPPSSKISVKAIALIGIAALLVVGGGALFCYLTWEELGLERTARIAEQGRADAEAAARIDAVNAAAQEKLARIAAEHTAIKEQLARNAAEEEAELQKQARMNAEEIARKESVKRDLEASARRKAELELKRERSEKERLNQAMTSQDIQAEKERVLELSKNHPTIKAIVSGELTFYLEPLPSYAASGVSSAVEDIANTFSSWSPYGATTRRVYSPKDGDITISWIRDYGTHILGESIHATHIKVGLGTTNCTGEWMAFDASTVKKILWHELGHSMGYGHSERKNNVMYPTTNTRFEVDQEISKVIAAGWYWYFPLCGAGDYYYSFETEEASRGFDFAVLPPGVDPSDFASGRGGSYSGCGAGSWSRYSNSCTVAEGAIIYIKNSNYLEAIRLSGKIIDRNDHPWPDMIWDEDIFQYDDTTLTRYWGIFHN